LSQYVKTDTYFYYKVYLPATNIVREKPIYFYAANGTLLITIDANDARMNYETGTWSPSGDQRNTILEQLSTASFWLNYSTSKLVIDFENCLFKISRDLIANITKSVITADFEYYSIVTPIDTASCFIDGRWDTYTQTIFYAKPPAGFVYWILDLGQVQAIQAIDMTHGFFKPDEKRSIDVTNKFTLQYSLDNATYYNVCKESINFTLSGGEAKSFERSDLGDTFEARYFRLLIQDMNKIDYGEYGVYVISLVEFAAYKDIVLVGEAKLIPQTTLSSAWTGDLYSGANTTQNIPVVSTATFDDSGTAYINSIAFTYGSKNSVTLNTCSGAGIATSYSSGEIVVQQLESDTLAYDNDNLLEYVGDKLYKETKLNEFLDTQERVDKRAKDYLNEFLKNHTRATLVTLYAPHVRVAQTLLVNDTINNISRRYFVESINATNERVTLTLAYYP